MDDTFMMCRRECLADLLADFHRTLDWNNLLVLNHLSQVSSLDEGHRDELHSSAFAEIVNAEDVLVRDAAGEKEFLLKALQDFRIRHELWPNDLERNHTIELQIVCLVDAAHTSFAQLAFHAIAWAEIRRWRRNATRR